MNYEKEIIGFTSGCFNLLHSGHIWFFNECKKLCDKLVVGVARDKLTSSKRIPVMKENERLCIVQNLRCVDEAYLEEEGQPPKHIQKLLENIKPDFYITTKDNTHYNIIRELCNRLNIEFVTIDTSNSPNISTTKIIKQIKESK